MISPVMCQGYFKNTYKTRAYKDETVKKILRGKSYKLKEVD